MYKRQLVEGAGNLIEVATDFSVFGGQPANGGQQFIIDRGNGNDGANRDVYKRQT